MATLTAPVKFIDVFNFAPVIVVGLFVVIGLWYALSAHKWFTGPKVQGIARGARRDRGRARRRWITSPSRGAVRSGRASRVS